MSQISIIITTSPIISNPSTEIVDHVIDGLKYVGPKEYFSDKDIYIVCDEFKVNDDDNLIDIKKRNYLLYIDQLKEKYSAYNILIRDKKYGCVNNIKYVLDLIHNDYVILVQHDWASVTDINIENIINAMNKHDVVKYVGFESITAVK